MADERRDVKAMPRTTIATATLEDLLTDSILFGKYTKVVEDPGVIRFAPQIADASHCHTLHFIVNIESKDRRVLQSGPRKDWRNILDKALTLWIEGSDTVVDPL